MIKIEEMKVVLINGSTEEIIDAISQYDISDIDKFGNNILHYFIKLCSNSIPSKGTEDWKVIIDLLLKKGISIEGKQISGNGCSPLHLAVLHHQKEITEYLISL